jgi:MFS family permease
MAGGGFLSTLIAVRLQEAGTSEIMLGAVAAAYFLGLTIGSRHVSRVVRRVGHIRAFAAFASLYSASALIYVFAQHPLPWAALRFVDGLCMAGVFICLESWLNERALPKARGTILAAYMMALYGGQAVGQFLLNLSASRPSLPFIAASILLSLTVIPVLLTRISQPEPSEDSPLPMRNLYGISPLGIVGALGTGLILGAFYGLGAAYARAIGASLAQTALFMSFAILGGVALQWPLGLLSDRFDRRRVLVLTFFGTLAAALFIAIVAPTGPWLIGLAALFGGLAFALYPLSVAHTNDQLDPRQRLAASGGLVLVYSAGAVAGPLVAASAMKWAGPAGLFLSIGLFAGLVAGFGIWRQLARPSVPGESQLPYQAMPRTTPAATLLDPRRSTRARVIRGSRNERS